MTHPTTYPISCTDCLTLVATADLAELTTATAITEHCRGCADCAGVVDAVTAEAQRLADLLDGTLPGVPAQVVALRAVARATGSRRRAWQRRAALAGVALVAGPLAAVALLRLVSPATPSVAMPSVARTVELACLAPQQAAELARPRLPADVLVVVPPALELPVLRLTGPERAVADAARLVAQIDARWGAERRADCRPAAAPDVAR
jgi:hypothetical protein